MNKWISVKDRLPTDSDSKYLTIEDDGRRYVTVGWYDPYEPEWDCSGKVIAWMDMDMPDVYEGE